MTRFGFYDTLNHEFARFYALYYNKAALEALSDEQIFSGDYDDIVKERQGLCLYQYSSEEEAQRHFVCFTDVYVIKQIPDDEPVWEFFEDQIEFSFVNMEKRKVYGSTQSW